MNTVPRRDWVRRCSVEMMFSCVIAGMSVTFNVGSLYHLRTGLDLANIT